jgi:hypothetical protein
MNSYPEFMAAESLALLQTRKDSMALPPYDILKKDAAALVWVEAAQDLDAAKQRIQELSAGSNTTEYVIFDQRSRQIVDRAPATAAAD